MSVRFVEKAKAWKRTLINPSNPDALSDETLLRDPAHFPVRLPAC